MKIEESKIFEFRFPYYGGEISIPVRAQTKDEAADNLKGHMNSWMIDLASEFPKTVPAVTPSGAVPSGKVAETPAPSVVPSYALELDIEMLIKDIMPIKKPKGANTVDKLVKDWTGFTYEPGNYAAIIEELRKLKATL